MMTIFCSVVVVLIASIIGVVTFTLGESISNQNGVLSQSLEYLTNKEISGHHQILAGFIQDVQKDIRRNVEDISKNPKTYQSMEDRSVKDLGLLLAAACQRTGTDFAFVYNIEGKLVSSIPREANALAAEAFLGSLGIRADIDEIRNGGSPERLKTDLVIKLAADSMAALELKAADAVVNAGILIVGAQVINDDFGDPYGICLSGKKLNGFGAPFKHLYSATGTASALYLETYPIAHAGFGDGENGFADARKLQIDSEFQATVFNSSSPVSRVLPLAGVRYLTTSTAIKDSNGENIGIICVAKPEKEIVQAHQTIMSSTIKTKSVVQRWLVTIGLASLVFFVIVTHFITRGMVQPLVALTESVRFIETEGDLTRRIDIHKNDEIGILANSFNKLIVTLQKIIQEINTKAESLAASSDNFSTLSKSMTSGASDMSGQSEAVSRAAEEVSATISTVAIASEEASANMTMVATAAEQMNSTVNEIAQRSDRAKQISTTAVNQAKVTSEKVGRLGNAANDINRVTEVITDISEQTNLLALNATIEAARAGESGKGFAVVANEIKALASQTAEATREIKDSIEGIQVETRETSDEIEDISKIINDVNEIVNAIASAVVEQSSATLEISDNVGQASTSIQEITQNINQTSTVSGKIAADIANVNLSAENIAGNSSHVDVSAAELSELAADLYALVKRFKTE